jgi:site-specific DNA-methyltransferase (adenine-specific)
MDKAILTEAKKLAVSTKTWADLSNALFDPIDGLVVRTYPNPKERAEFRKSEVYNKLHKMVETKMDEIGLIEGATPKKSGKFVVRLPRSLHTALEKEAEEENTSLNQLVVAKLAVQLDNLSESRLSSIIRAFGEVREGYSVDRVIADPQLNRRFLKRCREFGLSGTDFEINWELMNERKKSNLSYLPKTKRFTIREIDEFEYASELVVKFLQLEKNVSLDHVICDPDLAEEFDKYAQKLSPGYSSLQYRWAALGLRKAGRLGSMQQEIDVHPDWKKIGYVNSLHLKTIPQNSGLYLFSSEAQRIFIGQTDNLRHRIEKHMDVSSSRGLPDWLWDTKKYPLKIELASLPDINRSTRQEIELSLVKEWNPLLNYTRKVA